jgi:sulfite reductase beta subunit-like hemoprotein
MRTTRSRSDLCPGVFRPWAADDGALVRLRPAGGRLAGESLLALVDLAEEYGDGHVHLTARANLQLRGLPTDDGKIPTELVERIEAAGLLPSRTHELVRNIMVSPQTGLAGGRADLRPVVDELDRLICADPALAALPGRFLFVLDDGRGDLVHRSLDIGGMAVSAAEVQLRIGSTYWSSLVPIPQTAGAIRRLARTFLDARGTGPTAPWHVDELVEQPVATGDRHPATYVAQEPLPYGAVPGGEHVAAPDGRIDRALAERFAGSPVLVVTPWRGVLVPEAVA